MHHGTKRWQETSMYILSIKGNIHSQKDLLDGYDLSYKPNFVFGVGSVDLH